MLEIRVKAAFALLLILGCVAFAIEIALGYRRIDPVLFRIVFLPACLVVVTFFIRSWRRASYDIDKERVPLSQIKRGAQPLPPLVIDLPTISPAFLISHAPTSHLRVVENQNPTIPASQPAPRLTVVTKEES